MIDEAAAKVRMEASSTPQDLKKKEEELASLQKEKEAAVSSQDFEKAAVFRDKVKKINEEIEKGKEEWKQGNHDHLTVTAEDVAEVVSKWTGVPLQNLKESDSERLLHLEDELHKRSYRAGRGCPCSGTGHTESPRGHEGSKTSYRLLHVSGVYGSREN